ncbi:MAG TPA: helical backbone metal receptor [Candidatus Ratteibacteria bacterium]|nr:helical backbone metal receptor [Candidatus Ratteibacteria bacterium]
MKKIILILFLFSSFAITENLRIVSLCPYVTENLILLGEGNNIIGLTLEDEEEYKKGKEIIGSMLQPNIEKIVFLKPDIVIASKEGNRQESVLKLNQLGIKTLVLSQLFSINDIFKNFIQLSEITGKKKKGEEIVKKAKKKLKNLKCKKRKSVFFVLGWKPLITTGKNTFINEIIEISGGKNIFGSIEKKWIQVNIEEVVKRNPDVIIYIEMGENFDQYLKYLNNVKAVKENKILEIEQYKIASPTPKSIVDVCIKINKFINEN